MLPIPIKFRFRCEMLAKTFHFYAIPFNENENIISMPYLKLVCKYVPHKALYM